MSSVKINSINLTFQKILQLKHSMQQHHPCTLFVLSYLALHYHFDDKIIGMITALGGMAFRPCSTFNNCLISCGTHYVKDNA